MDQRSMDRKLHSLTIGYSTNAANSLICAKFCMQISLNITVTSVKLRASGYCMVGVTRAAISVTVGWVGCRL